MTYILNGERWQITRGKINQVITARYTDLLADTELTYTNQSGAIVTAGDLYPTTEGNWFEVAASDAVDQHITTAGGVKFYEAGPHFSSRARAVAAWARMVARSEAPPVGTVWTWPDGAIRYDGVTTSVADFTGWAKEVFGTLNGEYFGTRAEALAATVATTVQRLFVSHDGSIHAYRRTGPTALTPAITTNAGAVNWVPAETDECDAGHWGFTSGPDEDDSIAPTNRAALQAAMDWQQSLGGGIVRLRGRVSKVQPGIDIPDAVCLDGAGVGWFEIISSQDFDWNGTTLVGVGTPFQTKTVYGITNMSHAGGVVTNPDALGGTFSDDYALTDFTEQDASGTTAATLKDVSYVIAFDGTKRSRMKGIRVTHKNDNGDGNPINGFSGTSRTDLGDAIDIGILNLNSKGLHLADCQAFGYFRMAGFAQLLTSQGDDSILEATTFNTYERCVFSGYRGALVRSGDVYPVTASTTTTLEIPWTTSSFWESTGEFTDGSTVFTYTGLSQAGDKLTFTGVTPDPSGVAVNTEIRPALNFGTAFTAFRDCYIHGLIHQSALIASDARLGFSHASCAFEVSGMPLRDIELFNCHLFDPQCIIHAHDCGNLDLVGSYAESTSWCQTTPGSTRDGPRGARIIAANTTSGGWFGTYRAGSTALNFDVSTEIASNVDMYPLYDRVGVPAFTSGTGLCRPARITGQPGGQVFGERRMNSRDYGDNWNNIYTGGSENRLDIRDGDDRSQIANIDATTGFKLNKGSYISVTVTVADDGVQSVTPPKDGGLMAVSVENFAGFPQGNHGVLLHYDVGSSLQNVKYGGGSNALVSSSDVTGTTGADGNTTYGLSTGVIKIENRSGASCDYTVMFIS